MRVLFLCGFAWEPKGTVRARAFPLAAALCARGLDVRIVTVPYDNPQYSGRSWSDAGVQIKNIVLPSTERQRPLATLKRTLAAVEEANADIIHVFKPKGYSGLAAMALPQRTRAKVVLDCDDWEGWGGWASYSQQPLALRAFVDLQERYLLRRSRVVTVASRALESRVRQTAKSSVHYLPNCLNRSRMLADEARILRARTQLASPDAPQAPTIFYAGHFEPADDLAFVFDTVGPVAREHEASVILVGDGPMRPMVEQSFRDSGVHVASRGQLRFDDYATELSRATVAVFPFPDSLVYRAKCSVRILDYMSHAKAIISSAVGQNSEYLTHRETGLLAEAGNVQAFRQALREALQDPDLRRRLGDNARQRCSTLFAWEDTAADACIAAYQDSARISRA
jgi:glycosyltransferase involved in cell wall biosynthesis